MKEFIIHPVNEETEKEFIYHGAPELVRCKNCKHRPEVKKYVNFGKEEEYYVFPEGSKCPCQNGDDDYYSWNPGDDWFCADGEPKEGEQE